MFTGKISYVNANTISISPIGTDFYYRKYDFVEVKTGVYESATRDYKQCIKYYHTDTINIDLFKDRIDTKSDGTPDAGYVIYACWNGKDNFKYGLVKEGNSINETFDYYLRLPAFIAIENQEFLIFEDFYFCNNDLVAGGWVGIADNNLYLTGYQDYASGHEVSVRRECNQVQWDGSVQKSSGNFSLGTLPVITIPAAYTPTLTNHLFMGLCSNGCIIPIQFYISGNQVRLLASSANGSPTATNNITFEAIHYELGR